MKVTIVYGFLGSGKTTFLRSLIPKLAAHERVAVLVNEMGEVGIDGTVLESEQMNVQMMSNGCICCELRGDLFAALGELEKKFHPDRLVIEPTGLASPNQIDEVFTAREIAAFAKVDSLATILDTTKYRAASEIFGDFFLDQISRSSLVLINKADLVTEDEINEARNFVRTLNPDGRIHVTAYCEIDPMLIFLDRGSEDGSFGPTTHSQHEHGPVDSTQGMQTLSIEPSQMTRAQVEIFLDELAKGQFGTVLRAKGFINSPEHTIRIEYVMGQSDIHQFGTASPRIEFIGTDLKEDCIEEALRPS